MQSHRIRRRTSDGVHGGPGGQLCGNRGVAVEAPARATSKRLDIEGLRAVAVLLVMLYHAHVPVPGGRIGVDVFFVISGFIITQALLAEIEKRGTLSLGGFYARRAKRLLPAAGIVIVVTLMAAFLLLPGIRWGSIAWDGLASTFYVENWRLAAQAVAYTQQGEFHTPLQHYWSLGVEEQFYLIWPAFLLLVTLWPRWRRARPHPPATDTCRTWAFLGMLVVGAPSLLFALAYTPNHAAPAYYNTFARLWELALGGGVAITAQRLADTPPWLAAVLAWTGLAVLTWSAFSITDATLIPGKWALVPTLSAAAVIGFGTAAGRHGPIVLLGLRPMVFIGAMSYSLYLWHWPLLSIYEQRYGVVSATHGVIIMLIASAIAWASLKLVENPIRFNPGLKAKPARALRVGAVCMVVSAVAALGLNVVTPKGRPIHVLPISLSFRNVGNGIAASQRPPGAAVLGRQPLGSPAGWPVGRSATIYPDPLSANRDAFALACIRLSSETDPQPCIYGDRTSSTNVVLVGDSHAVQWAGPLAAIASERHWRLTILSMQDCTWAPPLLFQFDGTPFRQCQIWGRNVLRLLMGRPPQMLIVSDENREAYLSDGRIVGPDSAQEVKAYQQTWAPFLTAGTTVVALADEPQPPFDEQTCVFEHQEDLGSCSFTRIGALRDRAALDTAAKSMPGIHYIDLSDFVCPDTRCAPVIGNVMVWRDTNHLTATYAGTVGPAIAARLPALGRRTVERPLSSTS